MNAVASITLKVEKLANDYQTYGDTTCQLAVGDHVGGHEFDRGL